MRFTMHFRLSKYKIVQIISCFCAITIVALSTLSPVCANADKQEDNKISTDLLQQMNQSDNDSTIPVVVWFNDIEYSEESISAQANSTLETIKSAKVDTPETSAKIDDFSSLLSSGDNPTKLNDTQIMIEAKRKILSSLYIQANFEKIETLLSQNSTINETQVKWISQFSPIAQMNLTKEQILEISTNNIVEEMCFDTPTTSTTSDNLIKSDDPNTVTTSYKIWQKSTNITYVKSLGYDGSGVKVGLCDGGKLDYPNLNANKRKIFATLYQEGRLIADPNAYVNDPDHAISCGGIIAATNGTVPGIAPGATLYSTAGHNRTGGDYGAIEWLISRGCRIISISGVGAYSNTYGSYSKWIDHIAIQHDVTVVFSSGNGSSAGIGDGAMSYNAITVGSSDDRNTSSRTDDIYASFSSYYNGSSTTLPIKPDLVAPGATIQIPGTTSSGATSGITSGGTSVSCPIVAGVIALMYEMRPSLESNQALTKAILLAGISPCGTLTKKSTAGSTATAMELKTGAGLVDAKAMRYVAENSRFASGTMGSGVTTYKKTFTVSSSDTYTRVCLAWLKNNRISGTHTSSAPSTPACAVLYLKVVAPDGTVYQSKRSGGNVQLIAFEPTTTGTYTITVTKSSAPSSEPNVYFGLAWY